ncbi:cysteine hydrolase family protein [Georgenia sp. Z1491]|uniref:cysteine hydrolase family protein n=1 Tax=Georgenia sp. Z1491 TaxID=3416707 RepID=UPI003CEDC91F
MTAASVAPRPRSWGLWPEHVDLTGQPGTRPVDLGALPQRLTIDLARTAVVVVDMQNDFLHPRGWLGSIGVDVAPARAAIEPLRQLLPELRGAGVPVVWLGWGNRPDRANLPPGVLHVYDADGRGGGIGERAGLSPAVLTEDSWGAEVVDELTVEPGDLRVSKYRMTGFVDTPLDSILRRLRVDTLLLAGVNVDQCVLATLTDAAALGYDVVLVEGASATTSPDFCRAATLYNVRQCFGFTTTPAELSAALAPTRVTT